MHFWYGNVFLRAPLARSHTHSHTCCLLFSFRFSSAAQQQQQRAVSVSIWAAINVQCNGTKTCNYVKSHNNNNNTRSPIPHTKGWRKYHLSVSFRLLFFFSFPFFLCTSRLFLLHSGDSRLFGECGMLIPFRKCVYDVWPLRLVVVVAAGSYILVIICKPSMPHLTLSLYIPRNIKSAHETRMIIKSKLISVYLFLCRFGSMLLFCAIYEWFRDLKMWFLRLKSGHKERKETELYHIIKWG